MKSWLIALLALACIATAAPDAAEAKRLGAGRSSGLQRSMPARTAPDAPPPRPAPAATPAPGQQAAPANAPAPAVPAPAPGRRWLGPLAGLAAGLGLAALLGHFGLGGGLADLLMVALLAVGAVLLVRLLLRRFAGGAAVGGPLLAGAAAGAAPPGPSATVERLQRTAPAPALPAPAAAWTAPGRPPPLAGTFVPAAFDAEGFARTARLIFIRLQAANDAADLDDLRRFTTPELFAALRLDLQERGAAPQTTDVVAVDAQVIDVADEDGRRIVSVRFRGQVIEDRGAAPTAVDEVWHLTKPLDDSRDWAIAGIEQMN